MNAILWQHTWWFTNNGHTLLVCSANFFLGLDRNGFIIRVLTNKTLSFSDLKKNNPFGRHVQKRIHLSTARSKCSEAYQVWYLVNGEYLSTTLQPLKSCQGHKSWTYLLKDKNELGKWTIKERRRANKTSHTHTQNSHSLDSLVHKPSRW